MSCNATWLDFENQLQKSFSSVEYFVLKYGCILSGINMDQLNEQFLNYQLLAEADIPKEVKERTGLSEEDYYRIDVLWGFYVVSKNQVQIYLNSTNFSELLRLS